MSSTGSPNALVIINPKAGRGLKPANLQQLMDAASDLNNATVHVLQPGDDPTRIAREFVESGGRIVAAAGGDGTISSVANAMVQTDASLVPIPFGTMNHFCADACVHVDPATALQAIESPNAVSREIDVGCVNGRYFLDNSSLGLYPHLVKKRLKWHEKIGKWPAYFLAAIEIARHPVQLTVETPLEEGGAPVRVGLVFVSNNIMDASWPNPGRRKHLNEGLLQVFVVKEGSRFAVLRSAAAFLSGRTEQSPVINEHRVRELNIRVRRRGAARVSCDGEVYTAQPPIKYSIIARGLKLRLMPAEASTSEAA